MLSAIFLTCVCASDKTFFTEYVNWGVLVIGFLDTFLSILSTCISAVPGMYCSPLCKLAFAFLSNILATSFLSSLVGLNLCTYTAVCLYI